METKHKTTGSLKTIAQMVCVTALVVASAIAARYILHQVKHLYGLQPAGSGLSFFYDMIQ